MMILAAEALYYLLRTEWLMWRRGFPAVCDVLKRKASPKAAPGRLKAMRLCRAVDVACVVHFKNALCLERSAATVMLLRHHNLPAQLVIGAQTLPFKSHAWVELEGQVVNDKPYIRQLYRELERC